jgi:hypothetical protein
MGVLRIFSLAQLVFTKIVYNYSMSRFSCEIVVSSAKFGGENEAEGI